MSTSVLSVRGGRYWGRGMHFRVLLSGSWEFFGFLFVLNYTYLCLCAHGAVSVVAREGSRFSLPWSWSYTGGGGVVSCLTPVLGTNLRASGRAVTLC